MIPAGARTEQVSAFTSTFTVFILPCIFHVKLAGFHRLSTLELLWNAAIILLASIGAVFGTISALEKLFEPSHDSAKSYVNLRYGL